MDPNTYMQLPIPAPPQTQALHSTTFHPPPLDGSITVPEMYDWHLKHSPNHTLFVYSDDGGVATEMTMAEAVKGFHRAGYLIQSLIGYTRDAPPSAPYLAILAATGI